jgi:hypothetical protein
MPPKPSTRSSDTANSATMAISLMISAWLGSSSGARKPRATAPAPTASPAARSRLLLWIAGAHALPPWRTNRPLRPPQQDHDHQAVDDEGAHLGDVVLAGHVGDAEQQRGQQRAGDLDVPPTATTIRK